MLITPVCSQTDHADIVRQALAAMERTEADAWAFTQTKTEKGVVTVSRFDPSLPDSSQWLLLTIDGSPATAQEVAAARDLREADAESPDENTETIKVGDLLDLIDADSLTLQAETDDFLRFGFTPQTGENISDIYSHLQGVLEIARDGPYISLLRMWNPAPFNMKIVVKVSRYVMEVRYGPVGDNGAIMPSAVMVEIKGKAMLFMSLEDTIEMTLSDYQQVQR